MENKDEMSKKEKIAHLVLFALMIIGMFSCFIVSPTLLAFGVIKQMGDMLMYSSFFALGGMAFVMIYGFYDYSIWPVVLGLFMFVYAMSVAMYGLGFGK